MKPFLQEDPVPGICIILKDLHADFLGIQQIGDTSVMEYPNEIRGRKKQQTRRDRVRIQGGMQHVMCYCV